jgi:hypothetical protein
MSMLDTSSEDTNLEGLVLLDLPDHDSTEVSHHLEVNRLVQYADMLVWILDPQKYADGVVHERYLRPLSTHADVMVVVLNHIDLIPPSQREKTLADIRRLLVQDGLPDVPLLVTSAVTGEGIDDLKRTLVKRVREKGAARDRLAADVSAAADRLAPEFPSSSTRWSVPPCSGPARRPAGHSPAGSAGSARIRCAGCTSTGTRRWPRWSARRCPSRPRCSAPGST